ncbi:Cyanohydrin beta-glucosyltransferase [Bertholletia excelsa]
MQGHVTPLMKLSHKIAEYGFKVSFLVTEFIHAQMVAAAPELGGPGPVRLISVPDGLEPEDDRGDEGKVAASIYKVMPGQLEDFIVKTNGSGESDPISCVLADVAFGWAFEIARKMGLQGAMLWSASPGCLALALSIPKLVEFGVIDNNGTLLKNEKRELSPTLPPMSPSQFTWNSPGHFTTQKAMFDYIQVLSQTMRNADWLLCNWFQELNVSLDSLAPNLLSIGPVLSKGQSSGNFCREDSTCLSWLDKQLPRSVIYIAFGSTSKLSKDQLDALALGLELVGRPFLWVVRQYTEMFKERVTKIGKVVDWAPQERVLAHPSIGCFFTHCGWNSIMEGISMGVPFLCWPYFADQLYNQTCVCDGWKIGLALETDARGIVSGHELKNKLEAILFDDVIRANALKLKEMAGASICQGGSSLGNFQHFLEQIKH